MKDAMTAERPGATERAQRQAQQAERVCTIHGLPMLRAGADGKHICPACQHLTEGKSRADLRKADRKGKVRCHRNPKPRRKQQRSKA